MDSEDSDIEVLSGPARGPATTGGKRVDIRPGLSGSVSEPLIPCATRVPLFHPPTSSSQPVPPSSVPKDRASIIEIDSGDEADEQNISHKTFVAKHVSSSGQSHRVSRPTRLYSDDDDDLPDLSQALLRRAVSDTAAVSRDPLSTLKPATYSRGSAPSSSTDYGKAGPSKARAMVDLDEADSTAKRQKTSTEGFGMTKTQLKEQERQARKAQKELERAEKAAKLAREKEAKTLLKSHNKLGNQTDSCVQIMVDFSQSLLDDSVFSSKVYPYVSARFAELKCAHSSKDRGRPVQLNQHPNIIYWRRKVVKDWDNSAQYWVPRQPKDHEIVEEPTLLIWLTAQQVEEAVEAHKSDSRPLGAGSTLIDIVSNARSLHGPHYQVFLLVQNMNDKAKAKRSAENANWQAEARGQGETNKGKRRADKWSSGVSMEEVETELVRVTIAERCSVIRAGKYEETVDWLVELTKDISYRPYKRIERDREAQLNIDGRIESSNRGSLATTYLNQLVCINGITEHAARAIASRYPTWRRLLNAYKACPNDQARKSLLEGIPIGNNRTGAATDRCIGKAMSERVWIVLFTPDKDLDLTGTLKGVRARIT